MEPGAGSGRRPYPRHRSGLDYSKLVGRDVVGGSIHEGVKLDAHPLAEQAHHRATLTARCQREAIAPRAGEHPVSGANGVPPVVSDVVHAKANVPWGC